MERFADAVRHHQQGDLATAVRLYREVTAAEPAHADALRLLGVLLHQRGDSAAALDLIGRAIAADPGNAKAHDNRGFVLSGLGRRPRVGDRVELGGLRVGVGLGSIPGEGHVRRPSSG